MTRGLFNFAIALFTACHEGFLQSEPEFRAKVRC
jgi:hypothetical protein